MGTAVAKCAKHSRHKEYISIADFNASYFTDCHLGNGFKEKCVDFVKMTADRVVRIYVRKVSPRRPQFRFGNVPYLFYEQRGQNLNFNGSGWVTNVSGPFVGRCPCCQIENIPFWKFFVYTARHCVFDQEECDACDVVLFNDGVSKKHRLKHGQVLCSDTEKDYCYMLFCTHDKEIGERLEVPWTTCPALELLEGMCATWEESLDVVARSTLAMLRAKWGRTAKESKSLDNGKKIHSRMDQIESRLREIYRETPGTKFENMDNVRKQELYALWDERDTLFFSHRGVVNHKEMESKNEQADEELSKVRQQQAEIIEIVDNALRDSPHFQMPVFVISHPHGAMKFLSMGKYVGYDTTNGCFQYTSMTCSGSSGGIVIVINLLFIMYLLGKTDRLNDTPMVQHHGAVSHEMSSSGSRADVLTV